jgi:hypothetical protein
MKKLLASAGMFLLIALAVTVSPAVLFATTPAAWVNYSVLGTAVEVTAITAYADEHKRDLISTLVNGLDIANDITVIPNVKNRVALTKLRVGDGFRPYSATHEPRAGSLVFSDRYLETLVGKRDLLIDYRDFKSKHLAWRTRPGNAANKTIQDMDFAAFVWDQVIKGLQREINDETSYFGFDRTGVIAYNGPSTYVVGNRVTFVLNGVNEWFEATASVAANESPLTTPAKWRNVTARAVVPGLRAYIDAAIAASFPVTTTGAVTDAATALAAFKTLFRAMPVPYKNWGVIIHASVTDCEFLLDALATRTQNVSADTAAMIKNGLIPIPETNGKGFAKPATWLGTSRRLIAEPMEMNGGNAYGTNLVMGTDLLSDSNTIENIKQVYSIQSGIAFDLGFQIQDLDALRLGNQA